MAAERTHPLVEKFIRFFYWPKTVWVGNEFIFESHDEENNQTDYEAQKVPSSPSYGLKFLGAILYPFMNPVAWLISSIRELTNEEMVGRINQEKIESNQYKTKIKNDHQSNMSTAMSGQEVLKKFDLEERQWCESWEALKKKIKQPSDWVEYEKEVNLFITKASENFSLLLVAMSKIIEEEKHTHKSITLKGTTESLDTPEGIAARIIIQPLCMKPSFDSSLSFSFRFSYSSLIEIYHCARAKVYFTHSEADEDENKNETTMTEFPKGSALTSHTHVESFYTRNKYSYFARQTYNTNMKLFYNLFGGEKFRSALAKKDKRFDRWTRIDSSKSETFLPFPTTRPN